ncbi:hypothetical protein Bca4012_058375 [Brassica carinata]
MTISDQPLDIDSNRESESLEADSVQEKVIGKTYMTPSLNQIEAFEKEILFTESSIAQKLGVWISPEVEPTFILDVEKLIQKSLEVAGFVTHQLFEQMILRGMREQQHKVLSKMQKTWRFKYKLKKGRQNFSDKVFTEKEELQVVVCDDINNGP